VAGHLLCLNEASSVSGLPDMDILITGGTGLLGRALCTALLADGHRISVLSRRPDRVAAVCGAAVRPLARLADWQAGMSFDAIINLAGAPIVDLPWTHARKQVLWSSRIGLTQALVEAIAAAPVKPRVLLSGSAIGFYGETGDTPCSETSVSPASLAEDFSQRLCAGWESAAGRAADLGLRVCVLRTGIVLSHSGGMLGRMRLPFRLGLGCRLGDGRQWMSWIHIADWVGAVRHLLQDEEAAGAFNLTAPQPVRNADFSDALAASLGSRIHLAMPALALRALLGQRAGLLLGSQRILPARLAAAGHAFRFAGLAEALQDLHGADQVRQA